MPSPDFFDRLTAVTAADRCAFQRIPIIRNALAGTVDRPTYLHYLEQAYHHVRHTCPLMGAALGRCGVEDERYREALLEYIDEERGHEHWILDDIAALGGDAGEVARGDGNDTTRIMVGYAYFAIERISPYALLGMVHVLEGMSVALAEKAAAGIADAIGADGSGAGFSYLRSHGSLDLDHVRFFEELVNDLPDRDTEDVVIDMARIMYRLFGDIFRDIAATSAVDHAA